MFLDNKYTRWYFSIISRPMTNDGYSENHHIIPKSLGGSNIPENLVRLSPRTHLLVHKLLPRMTTNWQRGKMLFALRAMANLNKNGTRVKLTSREYEKLKIAIRKAKITPEHSKRISDSQRGKILSKEHCTAISKGLTGKIQSSATRKKIADSNLGKKLTVETKQKIGDSKKGKPLSKEHCAALSKSGKGKKASETTKKNMSKSQEKFSYTIVSPFGETFIVTNLKTFCKENNLPYTTFSAASRSNGKISTGWKISRLIKPKDGV